MQQTTNANKCNKWNKCNVLQYMQRKATNEMQCDKWNTMQQMQYNATKIHFQQLVKKTFYDFKSEFFFLS